MARPKTEITTTEPVGLNDMEAADLQREADIKSAELALIVRDFGNGIPFSPEYYKDKIIRHLCRSAEELLEASKALYVSYKHIEHGAWGAFLKEIGLEGSMARRMVQAAKKLTPIELRPLIDAAKSKSKILELVVLEKDELVKVAEGADDAMITLDEIECMPTSELRKALREARADGEANKKVLEDKNKKLDKLQADLEKAKSLEKPARPVPNYDVLTLQTELTEKRFEFELVIKHIESVLSNLRECNEGYAKTAKETFKFLQETLLEMEANLGISLLEDDAWLANTESMSDIDDEDTFTVEDADVIDA